MLLKHVQQGFTSTLNNTTTVGHQVFHYKTTSVKCCEESQKLRRNKVKRDNSHGHVSKITLLLLLILTAPFTAG